MGFNSGFKGLSCFFPYLAAHVYIASDLLFGPRCSRTSWCFKYFKSVQVWSYISVSRNHGREIMGYVYFHI